MTSSPVSVRSWTIIDTSPRARDTAPSKLGLMLATSLLSHAKVFSDAWMAQLRHLQPWMQEHSMANATLRVDGAAYKAALVREYVVAINALAAREDRCEKGRGKTVKDGSFIVAFKRDLEAALALLAREHDAALCEVAMEDNAPLMIAMLQNRYGCARTIAAAVFNNVIPF